MSDDDDDVIEAAPENFEQQQEPADNAAEGTLASMITSERKEARCKTTKRKVNVVERKSKVGGLAAQRNAALNH